MFSILIFLIPTLTIRGRDNKNRKKEQPTCCRELQAMHIHGGGLATSEQSNQNGWNKTSKVSFFFPSSFCLLSNKGWIASIQLSNS